MSEKKKYPSRKDLIAVEKQKSLQSEHVGCSDDGGPTYLIENLPNGVRNFEELASTGAKVFSMPDLNNGFLSQNEGLISFDNYFADNGVDECDNSHDLQMKVVWTLLSLIMQIPYKLVVPINIRV